MWRIVERTPSGFSHNKVTTKVVAVHNPMPISPGGQQSEPSEEYVRQVAEQWNSQEEEPVVMRLSQSNLMKFEPTWYFGH